MNIPLFLTSKYMLTPLLKRRKKLNKCTKFLFGKHGSHEPMSLLHGLLLQQMLVVYLFSDQYHINNLYVEYYF